MHQHPNDTATYRDGRPVVWRDRFRDPALTALLAIELCALFIAHPLAAQGYPLALATTEYLMVAGTIIVVLLSRRPGATFAIGLGLAAILLALAFPHVWHAHATATLKLGGQFLLFLALTVVVTRSVYAPGRITAARVQGAIVVYLNIGVLFALVFGVIQRLDPRAFPQIEDHSTLDAAILYYSFSTLTTSGYGDITPVHPLARSMSNLEAIVGQIFLATTFARLITLEIADSRR